MPCTWVLRGCVRSWWSTIVIHVYVCVCFDGGKKKQGGYVVSFFPHLLGGPRVVVCGRRVVGVPMQVPTAMPLSLSVSIGRRLHPTPVQPAKEEM